MAMFLSSGARGEVRPEELTIIYRSDSSAEAAAAEELQRFLAQMSGQVPRLLDEVRSPDAPTPPLVLSVGRTRLATALLANGTLREPQEQHPEAYLIRSFATDGLHGVLFLGGCGIATLYAVYHYLEHFCGVGFFWDGDHIPQRATVPVHGIEVATHPAFHERVYFNPCLWYYTVSWWGWDEWRRYIDWMLKNRFNILDMGWSPGLNALWQEVWATFGVVIADETWSGPPYDLGGAYSGIEPPLSAAWREGRAALLRQIIDYARARGMRIVAPHVSGAVPPEFQRLHPDAPLLRSVWAGFPPHYYLDPTSSLYQDLARAFLEAYVARYGTDHLYQLANLGELELQEPEEVKRRFRLGIARANFEAMDAVDPAGVGILPAWTYLGKAWTPSEIQASITALPRERIRVVDFWAEQAPLHRELDYFFNAPWYFGVFHAMGGDTHLHGNMPLLERRLKALQADPHATSCAGFALLNEVSGHNYFYYQFACKLGWNPSEVDLASFTHQYALCRYGEPAAAPMQSALTELLDSVYSVDAVPKPLYWHRLGSRFGADIVEGQRHGDSLRRALESTLKAAPVAQRDAHYLHDLNDIARCYLATLFNAAVLAMVGAYRRLDDDGFQHKAELVERYMAAIEELLSLDDYYWLDPVLHAARALPGAPADVDRRARDILTLWAGHIRDYACRDLYELVRYYYRPRVHAFVQELRRRLANGQCMLNYQPGEVRLNQLYTEIEQRWVLEGAPVRPGRPDPQAVVSVARRLLQDFPADPLPTMAQHRSP
jgi:hypothetical protein